MRFLLSSSHETLVEPRLDELMQNFLPGIFVARGLHSHWGG
jgi:hypothetical protein